MFKKSIVSLVALATILGMSGPVLAEAPFIMHMSVAVIDGDNVANTTIEVMAFSSDDTVTPTSTPDKLIVTAHSRNLDWAGANGAWSTTTCSAVESDTPLHRCTLTNKVLASTTDARTFQYYLKAGDGNATSAVSYAATNDPVDAESNPFQATVYNTPNWTNAISGRYADGAWAGTKDGRCFDIQEYIAPGTTTAKVILTADVATNDWIELTGAIFEKFQVLSTESDGTNKLLILSGPTQSHHEASTECVNKFVAGATVFVPGTTLMTTSSDVSATSTYGTFVLRNIPDGCWDLAAFKKGYKQKMMHGVCLNGPYATTTVGITIPYGYDTGGGGDMEGAFVTWSAPMEGMRDAPTKIGYGDMPILIGFSENLATSTASSTSNVLLKKVSPDGIQTVVSGYAITYEYQGKTSNFGTDAKIIVYSETDLTTSSQYIVVIKANVTDVQGNPVQGNNPGGGHTIFFNTGSSFASGAITTGNFGTGGSFMPPFVMGIIPGAGMQNVSQNTKIAIEFSQSMDSSTISSTYIKVWKIADANYTAITPTAVNIATYALDNATKETVILTPAADLAQGKYQVKILGGVKSASGIPLAPPGQETNSMFQSEFKTGASTDTGAPRVIDTNLMMYESSGVYTSVPTSGIFETRFSKDMDSTTVNTNTIYVRKKGSTSNITATAEYDAMGRAARLAPASALNATTTYILTLTASIKDFTTAENALAAYSLEFTTGGGDTQRPKIEFFDADDYQLSITFSEAMNAAKVTNTSRWPSATTGGKQTKWKTSVLNPANYIVYTDSGPNTPAAIPYFGCATMGTTTDDVSCNVSALSDLSFEYGSMYNSVHIKGLKLMESGAGNGVTGGVRVWINDVTDASGNEILDSNSKTPPTQFGDNSRGGPVMSSQNTMGMIGPGGGGMMGGMTGMGGGGTVGEFSKTDFGGKDPGMMGMMPTGVWPMNMVSGATSVYMIDLPLNPQTNAIPASGKIIIGPFPAGFDISGAKNSDPNGTFAHSDINGPGSGTVVIDTTTAESSGGLNNDGVTVSGQVVTINLGSVGTVGYTTANDTSDDYDFIHLELDGIKNGPAKEFGSDGYKLEFQIQNSGARKLNEQKIVSMPFFLMSKGKYTIVGLVQGGGAGINTVEVFGGSPSTGPLFAETANNAFGSSTDGEFKIEGLGSGMVILHTEPYVEVGGTQYVSEMPEPIFLDDNVTYNSIAAAVGQGPAGCTQSTCYFFKQFSLSAVSTDVAAPLVPKIAGFGTNPTVTTSIDIFAGGPNGFAVKEITIGPYTANLTDPWNQDDSILLYLPAEGTYHVGMGPAMPKGMMKAAPPPPTAWMPPPPQEVTVTSSTDGWVWSIAGVSTSTVNFTIRSADHTISGYVYDETGSAVTGASEIEVFAYSPRQMFGTNTHLNSEDGSFTLNVDAGFYKVGVFLPGLPPSGEIGVEVASDGTVYVDGTVTNSVILRLGKPDYTISGYVFSNTSSTQPAVDASVHAYRTDGPGYGSAMTDSTGKFILYVDEGTWTIEAYLPGYGDLDPITGVTISSSGGSKTSADGITFAPSATQQYVTVRERIFEDQDGSGGWTAGDTGVNRAFVTVMSTSTGYKNVVKTDSSGVYEVKVPADTAYDIKVWHPEIGNLPTQENVQVTTTDIIYSSFAGWADMPVPNTTTVDIYFLDASGSATTVDKVLVQLDRYGVVGVSNDVYKESVTSTSLKVPAGVGFDYILDIDIPGIPKNLLTISPVDANATPMTTTTVSGIDFATTTIDGLDQNKEAINVYLPSFFTISGTVKDDSGNAVGDATVHIELPGTDVELDVSADEDGVYTAKVYASSTANYLIQADKAGYVDSSDTVSVTASTTVPLIVEKADYTITGTLQVNDAVPTIISGQEPYVWAERMGGGYISAKVTSNDGSYTLKVPEGRWKVAATANEYSQEVKGQIVDVFGGNVSGMNLGIVTPKTLTETPGSGDISPTLGGTLSNSAADFEMALPRSPFTDSSQNTRQASHGEVSSVPSYSPTAKPIGGVADKVSISNPNASNGQGGTNAMLSEAVPVDKGLTVTELAAAGMDTLSEVEAMKMASYEEGSQNWETMPTTLTYLDSSDTPVIPTANLSNVNKVIFNGMAKHFSVMAPTDSSPQGQAPTSPVNFTITGLRTGMQLSWEVSTTTDITAYNIYRSETGESSSYILLNSIGPTNTSYLDYSASAGSTYYYWLTADRGLESNPVSGSGVRAAQVSTGGGGAAAPAAPAAAEEVVEEAPAEEVIEEVPAEEIAVAPAEEVAEEVVEEVIEEAEVSLEGISIPVLEKPVAEMTTAELAAKIAEFAAVINQLKALLEQITEEEVVEVPGIPVDYKFEKTLKYLQVSEDVKYLQIFLNSDADTRLAESGVGSPGHETNYFGTLTKAAVIKFQEKYASDVLSSWGLTQGTGLIGSTTRTKINELLGR